MEKKKSENPFSEPISRVAERMEDVEWNFVSFLPSIITIIVLTVVLLVLIVLWPYGMVPMVASIMWGLAGDTVQDMKEKSFADRMPDTIALGIYFILFLPFFIVSLPFYLFGLIGSIFTIEADEY